MTSPRPALTPSVAPNGLRTRHIVRLTRALEPRGLAQLLVPFRKLPIEAALDEGVMWLRTGPEAESLQSALSRLPGDHFRLEGEHWLIRHHCHVAEEQLPQLSWHSLNELLQFEFPSVIEGSYPANVPAWQWQLVRGGTEQTAAAVIVDLHALAQWVDSAPQWRLDRLTYVIRTLSPDDQQAIVCGEPLPPLPGTFLIQKATGTLNGSILIPAGMHWLPELEAEWVMRSFGTADDEWLIWLDTHDWSVIAGTCWMPLSRSSIRQTRRWPVDEESH